MNKERQQIRTANDIIRSFKNSSMSDSQDMIGFWEKRRSEAYERLYQELNEIKIDGKRVSLKYSTKLGYLDMNVYLDDDEYIFVQEEGKIIIIFLKKFERDYYISPTPEIQEKFEKIMEIKKILVDKSYDYREELTQAEVL